MLCTVYEVNGWFILLLVKLWTIAYVVFCGWGGWVVCALVDKNTDHCVCSVVWIGSLVVRALAGENADHHLCCVVDGWLDGSFNCW